jgi:DNA processing protein
MPHSPGKEEAVFYNALNSSKSSNYKELRKGYARHGSWENYWRQQELSGIDPEVQWVALRRRGIRLILADDPEYPPLLAEIPNPPLGIYFKGSLLAIRTDPAIAVVGTRKASENGKDMAREFGIALANAGCPVISGLAFGIDAAAHAGALSAKNSTVAVLANGLDRTYPSPHRRLADHIIEEGGALISEYPLGSPPMAHKFLERNRLVSGLARGVLAIEVPERSGVLSTARFALDQNRELFVVPGPARHPNYRGSHRLIRAGATLVTGPQDLLEDLGLQAEAEQRNDRPQTPQEEKVLAAIISAGRPLAIDEIIEAATLTSSTANQALTTLTLRGAVREEHGRYALR